MKIAIVDGYSTGRHLVEKLLERGVECVHLRSQELPPAKLAPSFVPDHYSADLGHIPDLGDAVSALKGLGVDRVVAGAECGVVLADTLSHELGLPGNEFATVRARRDKYAMADCLAEAGLAAPEGVITTDVDAAVEWFGRTGARVVVKPTESAGTDNVHICDTADQVRAACSAVLSGRDYFDNPNPTALVQKYLVGTEYTVNTVSVGGVQKVSDVWLSKKTFGPTNAPLYDYMQTLPLTAPEVEEVVSYVLKAVTALGITNGAAHSEVMLTADGPVLIETGARLMGAIPPDTCERHSSTSHAELLATSLTDPAAFADFDDRSVRRDRAVRVLWLINHRPGVSTSWRDRFSTLPTLDRFITAAEEGTQLLPTVDMATSPGLVSLAAETDVELDRDTAVVRSMEAEGLYLKGS